MNELIANQTWNNFHWPEWVPAEVKKQIMSCYAESWGEGPASWLEGAIRNRAPIFGDRVRVSGFGRETVEGRFVFAWNNIGRIVTDDEGHYECAGFSGFEVSRNGLWKKPEPCDYCLYDNSIAVGLAKYAANGAIESEPEAPSGDTPKPTPAEKEARLQTRIDVIVEQATQRLSTGQEYCAGDVLFDRRPLALKMGQKGRKL